MYQIKEKGAQWARRNKFLSGWYRPEEMKQYWKAIGDKNWELLKSMCRCYMQKNVFCPVCKIIELRKEYGKNDI